MNQKYRIIEKTYGDNHKEYIAQYLFLNFGLFKIWKNYICDIRDYGYGQIRCICAGETFAECKKHLLESIQKKKVELDKTQIISIKKILSLKLIMKVLERKEKPTAIVNCPHCGSKLEIDSSDIFWYKEIDGGNAPAVTCAVCHKGFDIENIKGITNHVNIIL